MPSGLLILFESLTGKPLIPIHSNRLPQTPRWSWILPHCSPSTLKHSLQHLPVSSVAYDPRPKKSFHKQIIRQDYI